MGALWNREMQGCVEDGDYLWEYTRTMGRCKEVVYKECLKYDVWEMLAGRVCVIGVTSKKAFELGICEPRGFNLY